MTDISKTFCPLPWNHLATNAKGNLRICCNSLAKVNLLRDEKGNPINIYDLTSKEVLDRNHTLMNVRKDMLEGKQPSQCVRCFHEEEVGVKSPRLSFLEKFPHITNWAMENTASDGSTSHRIEYLDLRLSNLCNLKCRMCNPHTSNQLVDEALALNLITEQESHTLANMNWPTKSEIWVFLDKYLPEVSEIYLTGGEPTLIQEQLILLQSCIDRNLAKNITLKYNTNMTNIPEKFLEYWTHFGKVIINCSVDGINDVCRYIRFPSRWKAIDKNLKRLESLMESNHNIYAEIHTTVQISNITRLTELFEYLKSYKRIVNFPFLNLLMQPRYYNIKVLPLNIKEEIALELTDWFDKNQSFYIGTRADTPSKIQKIPGLIQYMVAEDWSKEKESFIKYTKWFDTNRNEDFGTIAPKLKDWYNGI